MKYKKLFWLFPIVLITAFVFFTGSGLGKTSPQSRAAIVNDTVISIEEFNQALDTMQQQLLQKGQAPAGAQILQLRKYVLESLIDRELLYQESKNKGIKVNKDDVESKINVLKQRFSNKNEFKKLLKEKNLSQAALAIQIEKELSIQKFIVQEFADKVTITKNEAKAFYEKNVNSFRQQEQVKASHILIKVESTAGESKKAEAKKKIEDIRERLKKGENFETLAKELSEGPSSAKGGDLGFFGRGRMVKPFEEVAFTLKQGEISNIVETKFGFHLIKVTEKKQEKTMDYKDIEVNLKRHLKQGKVREDVTQHIKEVKTGAKVERFIDNN